MSDRNQHSVDVIVEKVNVDVLVGVCWYAWELWVWLGVAMVVDVATAVGVGVIVDVCGYGCLIIVIYLVRWLLLSRVLFAWRRGF